MSFTTGSPTSYVFVDGADPPEMLVSCLVTYLLSAGPAVPSKPSLVVHRAYHKLSRAVVGPGCCTKSLRPASLSLGGVVPAHVSTSTPAVHMLHVSTARKQRSGTRKTLR